MFYKIVQVLSLFLVLTSFSCNKTQETDNNSQPKGYSNITASYIEGSYVIYPYVSEEILQQFIRNKILRRAKCSNIDDYNACEKQLRRKGYSNDYIRSIARSILEVAEAFGIDPVIFAGLVGHESWYENKQCGVNGCGLTQMTFPGIEEVNHQLLRYTQNGNRVYSPAASDYFHYVLNNNPNLKANFSYVKMKRRSGEKIHAKGFPSLPSKKSLINHPKTTLMYGAMLLKIYLAKALKINIYTIRSSGAFNFKNPDQLSPKEMLKAYNYALRIYNNHPTSKFCYPIHVMEKAYRLMACDDQDTSAFSSESRYFSKSCSEKSYDFSCPSRIANSSSSPSRPESSPQPIPEPHRPKPTTNECWGIQVLALSRPSNTVEAYRKDGQVIILNDGSYQKVIVGAYSKKTTASSKLMGLKRHSRSGKSYKDAYVKQIPRKYCR